MAIKLDSNKLNRISDSITKLIQNEIQKKGLVDTGKMLNSISTTIKVKDSGLSIEISGVDYFKYLDSEENITEDAFKSAEYTAIINDMEDMYGEALEDSFDF